MMFLYEWLPSGLMFNIIIYEINYNGNIKCNSAIFDSILCQNGTEHVSLGNAFIIVMLCFFRPAVYLRCDWKR